MKLYDIDILSKDPNQNDLYDLTLPTFDNLPNGDIPDIFSYVVEKHEEMRIDLISLKTFGSVDYVDFLLDFNKIDLPLNIKSGDIIYYVDISQVDNFRIKPENKETIQAKLLNPQKATRKDANRLRYVENNYSLPPTIQDTPVDSVQIFGDNIVLGINSDSTF